MTAKRWCVIFGELIVMYAGGQPVSAQDTGSEFSSDRQRQVDCYVPWAAAFLGLPGVVPGAVIGPGIYLYAGR